MGIAGLSRLPFLSLVLAPLQALASLWVTAPPAAATPSFGPVATLRRCAANDPSATSMAVAGPCQTTAAGSRVLQVAAPATAPRRLKVVREFEPGVSPSCAGRMVISGRMADVCAELDRMAQRESSARAA